MAKRKSIRTAGRLVTGVVYTVSSRRDTEPERAAKTNVSSLAREKINLRRSWQKLEQVLAANFTYSDLHLTLTYNAESLPEYRDEAKKKLKMFIRRLREKRKSETGEALLYIYVTEGNHGQHRLHHHIVINGTGNDIATIRELWTFGAVRYTLIGEIRYTKLAQYLTKEPRDGWRAKVGERTWTPCKGLNHPKPDQGWVPDNFSLCAPPGAHILETNSMRNQFGEFEFIKYMLPLSAKEWPAEYQRGNRGKKLRNSL